MWTKIRLILDRLTAHGMIRSIIQTLSTSIGIQCLNIATGVLTARTLSPFGRGELTAIGMWVQFLPYTLSVGLPLSLIYFIRREPENAPRFLGAAILSSFVTSIIAMFVGTVFISHWLSHYPQSIIFYAQLAMVLAPVISIGNILTIAAQAGQNFKRYNQFRILPPCLILFTLSLLLIFHRLSPQTAAAAYLLSGLPIFLWNCIWAARHFRPNLTRLGSSIRKLFGYGFRAWGNDLIGTISDQIDRALVVGFLAPSQLGLYVIALSSARVFSIIPGAISAVLLPKLVTLGPGQGVPLLARYCTLVFAFMAAVTLPFMLLAHFAICTVYGADFAGSVVIFRILLCEAVFGGLTWMLAQGLSAFGKPGRSSLQQMVGLATAVPLMLILLPRFGIAGAGYALLGSTLARFGFAVFSYKTLFNANLSNFFSFNLISKTA